MRFFGRKQRRRPAVAPRAVNVYDYNHPPASVIGQPPWIWDIMSQRWIQSPYLTVAAPVAVPMVPGPSPVSGEVSGIF